MPQNPNQILGSSNDKPTQTEWDIMVEELQNERPPEDNLEENLDLPPRNSDLPPEDEPEDEPEDKPEDEPEIPDKPGPEDHIEPQETANPGETEQIPNA